MRRKLLLVLMLLCMAPPLQAQDAPAAPAAAPSPPPASLPAAPAPVVLVPATTTTTTTTTDVPATATVTRTLSPADAQALLDTMNDPAKRAEFARTLEALTKVAPQTGVTVVTPAVVPAPVPARRPGLVPNSLGARVVLGVSRFIGNGVEDAMGALHAVRSLPLLWSWVVTQATDPLAQARLFDTLWRLALVLAAGIVVEYVGQRLLRRPYAALYASARAAVPPAGVGLHDDDERPEDEDTEAAAASPAAVPAAKVAAGEGWYPDALAMVESSRLGRSALQSAKRLRRLTMTQLLRRGLYVPPRLLLELLPWIGYVVATQLVTASPVGGLPATRLILLELADAYALWRGIIILGRMILSPAHPPLRLLPMSSPAALYCATWLRRISGIAVYGYTAAEVGYQFGLVGAGRAALLKAVLFLIHLSVAIIILQKRREVRRWLRGPAELSGLFAVLRRRFSMVWHWIALFYVAALWVIWAAEIHDGYTLLIHLFFSFWAVLAVSRLLLISLLAALDRAVRPPDKASETYTDLATRAGAYLPALRGLIYTVLVIGAVLALLQIWGLDAVGWLLGNDLGHQVISALATVAITMLAALAAWEALNFALARRISHLTQEMQLARLARMRTLQPLLRSSLAGLIFLILGLLVLSEIGVNIAPLLAGAGVLGIAIGFGSQKLVQDVITGLFLLLDNAVQVGDVVSLGGHSGVVEHISVRTVKLRSEDGSVHVIPFSAVTTVTNMTRDFSYAVIEVAVGYGNDYERVIEVMQEITDQMRSEPEWENEILEKMEVWGLNKFTDSGVMVKCRIRCGPFGRWKVMRDFHRRLKARFDADHIYIARQYFADDAAMPGVALLSPKPKEITQ